MKNLISLLCLAGIVSLGASVEANNKVVVIPLGSTNAKGTDGQVQYNDGGTTAGAEAYYDKASGKLEVPGEVRTVDESGNNRLWGKGRPGTKLLTHTDPNGYCTTDSGIKHALSYNLGAWGSADNVCPAGTWVCSSNELPTTGSCPIEEIIARPSVNCDGTSSGSTVMTVAVGWVADVHPNLGNEDLGLGKNSANWLGSTGSRMCVAYRSWCCWE